MSMNLINIGLGAGAIFGGAALVKKLMERDGETPSIEEGDDPGAGPSGMPGGGPAVNVSRTLPGWFGGAKNPLLTPLTPLQATGLTLPQLRNVIETVNRYKAEEREFQTNATSAEKLRREAEVFRQQQKALVDALALRGLSHTESVEYYELARRISELEAAAEIYEGKAGLAEEAQGDVEQELERMMDTDPQTAGEGVVRDVFGHEDGEDEGGGEPVSEDMMRKLQVFALHVQPLANLTSAMVRDHVRRGREFNQTLVRNLQKAAGVGQTGGYDPATAGIVRYAVADGPAPLHFPPSWLVFDRSAPPLASADSGFYAQYFSDNARAGAGLAIVASNMVAQDKNYRRDAEKRRLVEEFQDFAFIPVHGYWDPQTADAASQLVEEGSEDLVPVAIHEAGHVPWNPSLLP